MEQINLDKLLQQAANKEQINAPDTAWPIIRDALHRKNKKRTLWIWFIPIIACSFVLGYIIGNKNILLKKQPNAQHFKVPIININDALPITASKNNIITSNSTHLFENKKTPKFTQQKKLTETGIKNILSQNKIVTNIEQQNISNEIATIDIKQQKEIIATNPNSKLDNNEKKEIAINNTNEQTTNENIIIKVQKDSIENINKITSILLNGIDSYRDSLPLANKKSDPVNKRWKLGFAASLGGLLVNENSIVNTLFQKNKDNNVFNFASGNGYVPTPLYSKSSTLFFQINAQKQVTKKIAFILGFQVQQNKFSTQVYATPNFNNNVSTLVAFDSLSNFNIGNSTLATIPLSNKPFLVQNKIIYLGAVVGVSFPLLTLSNKQKIVLQTQIVPSLSLGQNIYWFNKSNNLFYNNKIAEKKITSLQNICLQYNFVHNKYNYSIGPIWQFSAGSINKKSTNMSNVYFNTIGLQLGIKLK